MSYSQNQKTAHIRELQTYLNRISYYNPDIPCVIPTGVYDEKTAEAVRIFQKLYNLTETGETNQATWEKIVSVYQEFLSNLPEPLEAFPRKKDTVMKPGGHCFTIAIIQAVLFELSEIYENLPPVHVTGIYNQETMQAVQLFQKMCTLPVTGEVDCMTWNKLAQSSLNMIIP